MAGLFKYFKRQEKPTNSSYLLTRNEVEEANKAANKAVAKVLGNLLQKRHHEESTILTRLFRAPSSRNNEQTADDFLGTWLTTSLPFLITTAYGSFGFPLHVRMSVIPPQTVSKYRYICENL